MAMPASVDASAIWVLVMFLMWWVMMVAMMVPSATPMLLLFAAVKRCSPSHDDPRRLATLGHEAIERFWKGSADKFLSQSRYNVRHNII